MTIEQVHTKWDLKAGGYSWECGVRHDAGLWEAVREKGGALVAFLAAVSG